MDDGRTPDHGHPISSPCEPNGSGELINKKKNSGLTLDIQRQKNTTGNNQHRQNQYIKDVGCKQICLISARMFLNKSPIDLLQNSRAYNSQQHKQTLGS